MNTGRIIAGIVSLALAVLLYLSGYTQFTSSISEDILSTVRIYPAAFFGLVGLILVGNELIRDMKTKEI